MKLLPKVQIDITGMDSDGIENAIFQLIEEKAWEEDDHRWPKMFVTNGQLHTRGMDAPMSIDHDQFLVRLSEWAKFVRITGENKEGQLITKFVNPPAVATKAALKNAPARAPGLPKLETIIRTPYLAWDYNAEKTTAHLVTDLGWKNGIAHIGDPVYQMQIEHALDWLYGAFGDAAFADPESRTNFLCGLFAPALRPLLTRGIPMFVISKQERGLGASSLADAACVLGTGLNDPVMLKYPSDDSEMDRLLGTQIKAGQSVVVFDNITNFRDHDALANAITMGRYVGREISTSRNIQGVTPIFWATCNTCLLYTSPSPRDS